MIKAVLLKPLDGFPEGSEREFDKADFDALKALGAVRAAGPREDGPTIAEYLAAGYLAENYPPQGYVSRSTPEEIAIAVAAHAAAASQATAVPPGGEKMAAPPANKMAPPVANKAASAPASKGSRDVQLGREG